MLNRKYIIYSEKRTETYSFPNLTLGMRVDYQQLELEWSTKLRRERTGRQGGKKRGH